MYYILKDKIPVPCDDTLTWAKAFETTDRVVANNQRNKIRVSTVFLGLDHGYNGNLLLFETMIFGGKHDQEQWRYATWAEAEIGHRKALALIGEFENLLTRLEA